MSVPNPRQSPREVSKTIEVSAYLKEVRIIFLVAYHSQRENTYSHSLFPFLSKDAQSSGLPFSVPFQGRLLEKPCCFFPFSKQQSHQNILVAAICCKQNTTPFAIYSAINLQQISL